MKITYDPDDGCLSCPLAWRDVTPELSVLVFCDAEWRVRYAAVGRKPVSRHPAPDWCPLRSGPVVVEPRGE